MVMATEIRENRNGRRSRGSSPTINKATPTVAATSDNLTPESSDDENCKYCECIVIVLFEANIRICLIHRHEEKSHNKIQRKKQRI